MKRRSIMMSVVAILLMAVMLIGCGQSGNELPISRNEAKEIAIRQLGVTADLPSYAVVTTAGPANDPYYIVEVLLEGVAYSYRIDPQTGDIRKLTINDQNVDLSDLPINPGDPNASYIGLEAAKAVAFTDAGVEEVSSQSWIMKWTLPTEDIFTISSLKQMVVSTNMKSWQIAARSSKKMLTV